MMNLSLFGAWLALYFLIHSHDALQIANLERAELRAARTENQLRALQSQMNPHFLFNSLNTIRALVPPSNPEARQAVTLLADILRATLREGGETVISLERELAIVRTYLAMEKLRFEDNARIRETIHPECLSREVPPLTVLTLVENAVKHGLVHAGTDGELTVSAEIKDDWLRLCVTSPGKLRTPGGLDPVDSLGLGIRNCQERLRLIFGPQATLELADERGLVEAVILIPPHRSAAS
jgi:LytS/YehU family sensor histidine kinase